MSRPSAPARLLIGLLAIVLIAAACGSDDDGGESGNEPTSSTEAGGGIDQEGGGDALAYSNGALETCFDEEGAEIECTPPVVAVDSVTFDAGSLIMTVSFAAAGVADSENWRIDSEFDTDNDPSTGYEVPLPGTETMLGTNLNIQVVPVGRGAFSVQVSHFGDGDPESYGGEEAGSAELVLPTTLVVTIPDAAIATALTGTDTPFYLCFEEAGVRSCVSGTIPGGLPTPV